MLPQRNLLYLYVPPLDVKRGSKECGDLDTIFPHVFMPSKSIIYPIFLARRDEDVVITPDTTMGR